ncbi:MAG: VanZ family protein [Coprobacillus sp.]
MSYIIESLANYIFLFFLFCLLEVILLQYYKKKQIKVEVGFIIGYQLLICLLIAIFTITGISGINQILLLPYKHMNFVLYLENIFSYECIMNMIMFIPLGIILPLLWKNARKLYLVLISGFSLSLLIEISQLFNHRASDINDIVTNTIGILLGYIIYKVFFKKVNIFELDDQNKITQYHGTLQIIVICIVYFFIGSPILSLIRGF